LNEKRSDETINEEKKVEQPKTNKSSSEPLNEQNHTEEKHKRNTEEQVPASTSKPKKGSKRNQVNNEEKSSQITNVLEDLPSKIEDTNKTPSIKPTNPKSAPVQRKIEEQPKKSLVNETKSTPLISLETPSPVVDIKPAPEIKKEKILLPPNSPAPQIQKSAEEISEKKEKVVIIEKKETETIVQSQTDNIPIPPQNRYHKPVNVYYKKSEIPPNNYRTNRQNTQRITKNPKGETVILIDKTGKRTARYVPKYPQTDQVIVQNNVGGLSQGINPAMLSTMPSIEFGGRQYRVLQKDKTNNRYSSNAFPNRPLSSPTEIESNSLFSDTLFSYQAEENSEVSNSFFSSSAQPSTFQPMLPSYDLFATSTFPLFPPQKASLLDENEKNDKDNKEHNNEDEEHKK